MPSISYRTLTRFIGCVLVIVILTLAYSTSLIHNASEISDDNNILTKLEKNSDTMVELDSISLKKEILYLKEDLKYVMEIIGKNVNASYNTNQSNTHYENIKEKIEKLEASKTNIDTEIFSIKTELDKLRTLINAKNEEGTNNKYPWDAKFFMIIPGFGPNNQYLGMMDSIFISKKLGRIFATPDFFLHAINDLDSIRSFELTFERGPLSQYIKTVSLQEYVKQCKGNINSLVWLRNPERWLHVVEIYLRHARLTYTNVIYTPNNGDLWFQSDEHIKNYFAKISDQNCIAICFPYASVYMSPERKSIIQYLHHSKYVKDMVMAILNEIGTTLESLLTIHWRFGEDSCAWYNSPDPGYEFCWGTAQFHYAKLDDVLFVLTDLIRSSNLTHVYLSVASHYLDPKIMNALDKEFKEKNIKYYRSVNISALSSVNDNYYLSLIEQELSATSKIFCRSDSSTWSDYVVDWVRETGRTYPTIVSIGELLKKHNRPYKTWNREADEPTLQKFKRPDGWWKSK